MWIGTPVFVKHSSSEAGAPSDKTATWVTYVSVVYAWLAEEQLVLLINAWVFGNPGFHKLPLPLGLISVLTSATSLF